jgi:hypothetical protein
MILFHQFECYSAMIEGGSDERMERKRVTCQASQGAWERRDVAKRLTRRKAMGDSCTKEWSVQ